MVRPLERPHFVLGINSLVHFFAELPVLDISSLVESVTNSSHSLLLHEPKIKLKRSQTQKQNKKILLQKNHLFIRVLPKSKYLHLSLKLD